MSTSLSHKLRKVRLTILSEEVCKLRGSAKADNLGDQIVVNWHKELCGAFVNSLNMTYVNYTLSRSKEKYGKHNQS